ncbi:dynamin family protein [Rothia kristinae]|uniref:dynamin family protein n=1 Tax=Rothia kristinae TaxID=37923 RepID=UPI0022E75EC6|nr:dynamin family protein [Rothia kristinae]
MGLAATANADSPCLCEGTIMDAARSLAGLGAIAARHGLSSLEERCAAAADQVAAGSLTVAVLGRFKAGKSTLLNDLLGADLLPVQAIPATSVITRVRWGPALRVTVMPRHGDPFDIAAGSLGDWVTEAGNPGNQRQVERVDVASPALSGLRHLVLVDTPGTGSSWQQNTDTSLSWLPHVGAALILVNATQPLAEEDLRLVELVRPHTPNIIIGLSKTDLLSDDDLAQVERHVRGRLAEAVPGDLPVVPLCSGARGEALRARLWRILADLDRSHLESSATLASYRSARLIAECRQYLQLAGAAASAKQESVRALRCALDREADDLPRMRARATGQLEPARRAVAEAAEGVTSRVLSGTVRRVRLDLEAEQARWHSSLAAETRTFQGWIGAELDAVLAPVTDDLARALETPVRQAVQGMGAMGEAFVQRLGGLAREAVGIELDLPVPQPGTVAVEAVDIVVDAAFDSHVEMLSWAVPMAVVRPAVHRHFRRDVAWQVEKNVQRTGYRAAAAARRSLEQALDEYLERLAAILADCRGLVSGSRGGLATVQADLEVLDGLAGDGPG